MHRLTRCLAWIGATLVVWGCSGDPTSNKGTPTDIVADPGALFVTQGDSQAVIATVVDEDGQALVSDDFAVASVGPGVSAFEDPNFLLTLGGTPIHRQHRIYVKAIDVTATTVTVTGLGLSKEIRVTTVAPAP
jgi:hypothetical protein